MENISENFVPPEEMTAPQSRFDEAISFFPEDEQAAAIQYLEIYSRFHQASMEAIRANNSAVYSLISRFRDANKGAVEGCKLYHLFAGSSLSQKEWESLPMDIGGVWQNFIENSIEPLIGKEAA